MSRHKHSDSVLATSDIKPFHIENGKLSQRLCKLAVIKLFTKYPDNLTASLEATTASRT